ncbi:MAG: 50S ribosomal protein L18a [Candidatus Diapherotrites archaeon]|uniref:Large ribosomal subunit protein eL20 n=1 Tax=Candidatus Iainarchaeum sp. TaxID=3101447 RepID=A0A8T4KUG9_9ARCH|nr:50S ribosomal protein L18a [Candidatus Diapherotrites archaeon]
MAEEKKYEFSGKYFERGEGKKFTKSISALNEARAKDLLYSLMGSKHKLRRHNITIEECREKKG